MNPAKAPWYFLGLQEMLVYFDPWMAGVIMPTLIIVGLMVIPYIDANPLGNGYYTYKQRKFAIWTFLFGFIGLWVLMIVIGTFIRGPGWMWFWPGQTWDAQRVEFAVNRNVDQIFGIDGSWLSAHHAGGERRVRADSGAHYFRNFSDRCFISWWPDISCYRLVLATDFSRKNFQAHDAAANGDDGTVSGADAEPAGEDSAAPGVSRQVRVGDAVVQYLRTGYREASREIDIHEGGPGCLSFLLR